MGKNSLKKIIHLYYWNQIIDGKMNFGDMFSKDIVEYVSGAEAEHVKTDRPDKLLAVGSILNHETLSSGGVVWGSGTMDPSDIVYNPKVRFCAVRGPLTRKALIDKGYKVPSVYGDPVLLLPRIYNPQIPKTHKLGIILHWRHRELLKIHPSVKYIDILRKPEDKFKFIDDILSCERILSTSLHGLIVSDAYGVPSKYCTVSNSKLEGKEHFKFNDYFESIGRKDTEPLPLHPGEIITENTFPGDVRNTNINLDLDLLVDVFPYDLYREPNFIYRIKKLLERK